MINYIEQRISLTEEEKEVLHNAEQILRKINSELINTPTASVDEQKIDSGIEEIVKTAIEIENNKIFSVFNCLGDEKRKQIVR